MELISSRQQETGFTGRFTGASQFKSVGVPGKDKSHFLLVRADGETSSAAILHWFYLLLRRRPTEITWTTKLRVSQTDLISVHETDLFVILYPVTHMTHQLNVLVTGYVSL